MEATALPPRPPRELLELAAALAPAPRDGRVLALGAAALPLLEAVRAALGPSPTYHLEAPLPPALRPPWAARPAPGGPGYGLVLLAPPPPARRRALEEALGAALARLAGDGVLLAALPAAALFRPGGAGLAALLGGRAVDAYALPPRPPRPPLLLLRAAAGRGVRLYRPGPGGAARPAAEWEAWPPQLRPGEGEVRALERLGPRLGHLARLERGPRLRALAARGLLHPEPAPGLRPLLTARAITPQGLDPAAGAGWWADPAAGTAAGGGRPRLVLRPRAEGGLLGAYDPAPHPWAGGLHLFWRDIPLEPAPLLAYLQGPLAARWLRGCYGEGPLELTPALLEGLPVPWEVVREAQVYTP